MTDYTNVPAIENAIIARINQVSGTDALGYELKKVESYSGQFDADEFTTIAAQFPLVLVAYLGEWKRPEQRQGGRMIYPQFSVMAAARNARNTAAARKGAGDSVGAAQIAADMRRLLTEQDLGLPIDALQPTQVQMLVNSTTRDRYAAVFGFELETGYFEPAPAVAGVGATDLAVIFAQWDLPPHFGPLEEGEHLPRVRARVDSEQTTPMKPA